MQPAHHPLHRPVARSAHPAAASRDGAHARAPGMPEQRNQPGDRSPVRRPRPVQRRPPAGNGLLPVLQTVPAGVILHQSDEGECALPHHVRPAHPRSDHLGLQPGRERPGDHPRPDDRRPVRRREDRSALQRTAAPGAERRLRGARGLDPLPQLPRRPRNRREPLPLLLPGPVLRLLPHHADARVRRPQYRPARARPRVSEHALVPRPPRRAHGGECLQGAVRLPSRSPSPTS